MIFLASLYRLYRYIVDVLAPRSILSPSFSYPHPPMGGSPKASQTLSQRARVAGLSFRDGVRAGVQDECVKGSEISMALPPERLTQARECSPKSLGGLPGREVWVESSEDSQGFSEASQRVRDHIPQTTGSVKRKIEMR